MPDRKDPIIAAKENYVPLQELVSAYCQKPEDVSFREHLGPAWRSLLGPNRWLMIAVDCLAVASSLAVVFPLLTVESEWGNLATPFVAIGALLVTALCLFVRRRPASSPRQIIGNAKGSRIPVGLFLRLHDHLKSGELVAYQDKLDHTPVKRDIWRAEYGWLAMLG
jgi:hypothetical protein